MRNRLVVTIAVTLLIPLPGCVTTQDAPNPAQQADSASARPRDATPSQPTPTATDTPTSPEVSMTRVRFSTKDGEIVVRVADNPTSRDFLSRLPMTLTFEEFAGREKISYLPERLTTEGSPGSAARNGDLIYYVPWGNLGFFYNADPDGGHDNSVVPIGRVESGMDLLDRLEAGQVTVEAID